ncbi:MAG: serine/threonine protein kinase, partial [Kofleriaceae bacterium]
MARATGSRRNRARSTGKSCHSGGAGAPMIATAPWGRFGPVPSSTETAIPARDAEIGAVIDDRYRLIERIGLGGMGAVYKAEHVGMGRVVAVKLLRPEMGGRQDAIDRFTREAQASARVSHKNVCAVSDFGVRDDGALYLVMEYLRGETLRERLDKVGRLPWSNAVTIARHVARGLAHAHAQGVIHRDVKPENVFLVQDDDDDDFAKLLDFGIARSLENDDA